MQQGHELQGDARGAPDSKGVRLVLEFGPRLGSYWGALRAPGTHTQKKNSLTLVCSHAHK